MRRSVRAGAAVVCFSADKLLGGPQAGLMVGTHAAIDACRRHPLARAVRIDKLSLAALEATLALYRDPELARAELPVLAMLEAGAEALEARARRLADGCGGEVVAATAKVGGGALPLLELPGPAVAVDVALAARAARRRPAAGRAGSPTGGCCSTSARSPTRRPTRRPPPCAPRARHDAPHPRHRRPHRPRQDRARRRADRRGHRPPARREGARDLDRARLRAARPALGAPAVGGRRARPRALRAHDGRRRHGHRPLPDGRRRRRRRDAPDPRARRGARGARRGRRRRRGDQGRPRRPGARRGARRRELLPGAAVVACSARTGAGVGRGARRPSTVSPPACPGAASAPASRCCTSIAPSPSAAPAPW